MQNDYQIYKVYTTVTLTTALFLLAQNDHRHIKYRYQKYLNKFDEEVYILIPVSLKIFCLYSQDLFELSVCSFQSQRVSINRKHTQVSALLKLT